MASRGKPQSAGDKFGWSAGVTIALIGGGILAFTVWTVERSAKQAREAEVIVFSELYHRSPAFIKDCLDPPHHKGRLTWDLVPHGTTKYWYNYNDISNIGLYVRSVDDDISQVLVSTYQGRILPSYQVERVRKCGNG